MHPSRRVGSTATRGDSESIVGRRHRPDFRIVLYMGLAMLFGLIVIYAIGPQRANILNSVYGSSYSEGYFFMKQGVSLLLALLAFAAASLFSYKTVLAGGKLLLIAGLAACALLAIGQYTGASFAQCSLGACRWFDLGFFGSLQPSEFLKFGVLVYLAGFLGLRAREGRVNDLKATLLPVGIVTALSMLFVIVIQKDLGTGIALTAIIGSMLFIAGLNRRYGLLLLAGLLVAGVIFIVSEPHRLERMATYLQGDSTSTTDAGNYHIQHAKIALGSGGFFGVGVGNSVQATGYLPEAINDSVFAIIGETFGFVGTVALLALFFALLMRLVAAMERLLDWRAKLLVAGVFGWLVSHVMLNIAAMIGVAPLTGITLPLLSFGGTSMVFIAAALGLVFQLSRYTVHSSRIKEQSADEDSLSRRRVGRSRYASRRGH